MRCTIQNINGEIVDALTTALAERCATVCDSTNAGVSGIDALTADDDECNDDDLFVDNQSTSDELRARIRHATTQNSTHETAIRSRHRSSSDAVDISEKTTFTDSIQNALNASAGAAMLRQLCIAQAPLPSTPPVGQPERRRPKTSSAGIRTVNSAFPSNYFIHEHDKHRHSQWHQHRPCQHRAHIA